MPNGMALKATEGKRLRLARAHGIKARYDTELTGTGIRSRPLAIVIALIPIVVVTAFAIAHLGFRDTPPIDYLLELTRGEDGIIETMAYTFAFVGGGYGLVFVRRLRKAGMPGYVIAFYSAFSSGLLLIGFEEISWGQHILQFETPEFYKELNAQGELNLHNIKGWSGTNSVLRILFGAGGLLGLWLGSRRLFRPLAPSRLLLSWFATIAACAVPEGILDLLDARDGVVQHFISSSLPEVNEVLVAASGALYLYLQSRRITPGHDGARHLPNERHAAKT